MKEAEDSSEESDEDRDWLMRLKAVTDRIESEEVAGLELAGQEDSLESVDETEDLVYLSGQEENILVAEGDSGSVVDTGSSDEEASSGEYCDALRSPDVTLTLDDEEALATLAELNRSPEQVSSRGERCSTRRRAPTKRFEYTKLGKPTYG